MEQIKVTGYVTRKTMSMANLVLSIASICLSLGIAEIALRSFIPIEQRQPYEFRIPDPVLGWVLKPNASYVYVTPESTVSMAYNSMGWRDIDHSVTKPDGVFRILVLGDSFMEANAVELDDTFARRVEELARDAGSDIEVINMGVGGYGTLQEYLAFRDFGPLYEPDLVLLAFYPGNDLTNDSLELASIPNPDGQPPTTRPFLDPSEPTHWKITPVDFGLAQRRYSEYQAILEGQKNSLSQRLILLKLARAGIENIFRQVFLTDQESNVSPINRERHEMASLGEYYCEEPDEFTRAWDTTERILAKLKAEVESVGSRLIVFSVPAMEEVSVDRAKQVIDNATESEKLCLEDAPAHVRLGHILAKLHVEYIPLLSDFRWVMREHGIQLYGADNEHWNPEGHRLAAERVVTELIKRGLLPVSRGNTTSHP